MTVSVEKERYLAVGCGEDEQIIFDRSRDEFHLLRGVAAQIWKAVCEGGTFSLSQIGTPEVLASEQFATALRELEKANLLVTNGEMVEAGEAKIDRRAWLGVTGKAAAAATVLPLVMTLAAPAPGLATAKKYPFKLDHGKSPFDGHDSSPKCDSHSNKDEHDKDHNWWDSSKKDESKKDESNKYDNSNSNSNSNRYSHNSNNYNKNKNDSNTWWRR